MNHIIHLTVLAFISSALAAPTAQDSTLPATPDSAALEKARQDSLDNCSRRGAYMVNQSVLSSWIYGFSLPLSLTTRSDIAPSWPALAVPTVVMAHIMYSRDHRIEQNHLSGINDAVFSTLWLSYAAGFTISGADVTGFRIAAITSAATYPLAIHYGYNYGRDQKNDPCRPALRTELGAITGSEALLLAASLSQNENDDAAVRISAGSALAGYLAGHVAADFWQPDRHIAGGVPSGIAQLTYIGGSLAFGISYATGISENARITSMAVGGMAGTAFGLNFFRDSRDTKGRAGFTLLGMAAVTATSLSMFSYSENLFSDNSSTDDDVDQIIPILTVAPLTGYLFARFLTQNFVEPEDGPTKASWLDHVDFNPVPVLASMRRTPRDAVEKEWRLTGLSVQF